MPKGLKYWTGVSEGPELPGEEAYATMMALPGFADACRKAAELTIARNNGDAVMRRLLKDGSSLFFAVFALYLDAQGELTLSAIQQFCQKNGLQSPGRSSAILIQMRLLGFVVRDPSPAKGRTRRYVPSEHMKSAMRQFFSETLVALGVIEPEALEVIPFLGDPYVFKSFVLAVGLGLEHMLQRKQQTEIVLFVERNLGLPVLFDISLSPIEAGDVHPPRGPVRMSPLELARRYAASRSHITRLLNDAEKKGLLVRNGAEATGRLLEILRQEILRFHAGVFMGNAACAYEALQAARETVAQAAQ